MNKEELIGKLQMVYVGDKNALNELIGYYDGLKQGIEELQQENQQLKEMIDEQDGCNKRRLQIFDLKDKLCKELKNIKILKQENKILRENAEHNGKVVDKVNWENRLLKQQNQKYKEVIDKLKEWEQTHTILVYTKEAPRQLVGTHELLHILYDKEVE